MPVGCDCPANGTLDQRQAWTPIIAIDVALGCLLARNAWRTARWTAQKKQWIWPETLLQSFESFKGLEGFRGLGAGKRQAWTPIRSHWCGLGMPVGCECLVNGTLDRREKVWTPIRIWPSGTYCLRWTPIRSHWCGLGMPVAKKDKFHTCGGPRRRPCLGEGRGRRIM